MKLNKTIKGTLVCLGFSLSFIQAFASTQKFEIDIVATDAVTALNSLASQTDFPLLFNFDQMRDLRVNSLKGTYTLQEALDLILRDSGFSGNLMNREVITISPIKPVETQKEEDPMIFKGTKKNLLTSASAALMAVAATPIATQAQTASQPVDEVIATGIRQSLKAAADLKRNDSRIVDAIVAEDIGKLPDNNIAEALQRITGVSINTDFGVGDSVSIRGLSQNRVELNGRSTLGDSRDGVSLQDFPSSFLKSVEVIKSPTADMIEGALGGTVRMNTVRPLELSEFTLAGSLDLEYADKTQNVAPIANISAGNVWDLGNGGTFGAIGMVSYQKREIRQDEFYNRVINVEGPSNLTSPTPSGLFQLRDQPTLNQFVEERERTAFNVSLEYTPASEKGRIYLDLSTAERDGLQSGNSILDVAGGPVYNDATTVDAYGQLNNFTITPAFVIPKTWSSFRNTKSFSHALGVEWDISDDLNISVEGSIASSETYNPDSEFNLRPIDRDLWQSEYVDGYTQGDVFPEGDIRGAVDSIFYQIGDQLPSVSYDNGQAYLDPNTLAVRAFWSDDNRITNDETALRFDVDYKNAFGIEALTSLKAGARLSNNDYTFSQSRYRANNIYKDAYTNFGTDEQQPFALWIDDWENLYPGSTEVVNHHNTFSQLGQSGPFDLGQYLVYRGDLLADPQATFERIQQAFAGTNFATTGSLADNQVLDEGAFRDVREQTSAFYVSADLDFDRIQANVGVRYVTTDIESDQIEGGVKSTDEHSYDDILPSLNVSYDIDDNTKARFAAAKVMRRADYSALSSAFLINSFFYSATQGDVEIAPYRATQYDLSLEHYLGDGGIISGAVFYKDVESFLTDEITCQTDSRTVDQNTTEFGNICLLGILGGTTDNIVNLTVNDFSAAALATSSLPGAADLLAASGMAGYDAGDAGTDYVGGLAAAGQTGVRTSTKANGENGTVWGIELGLQYQLDFLPGALAGLGFNGNYTYAESEQPNGNALLDISKHTLNTQVYWENEVFQARLAYNYRSDFLDTER